jgi:hypothetical protein
MKTPTQGIYEPVRRLQADGQVENIAVYLAFGIEQFGSRARGFFSQSNGNSTASGLS